MLVNMNSDNACEHVKFISYDGKYPNLCSGTLILEIDGKEVKFGTDYYDFKEQRYKDGCFGTFWTSGGVCEFLDDSWDEYVAQGEWNIDIESIPEQYRQYAAEIDSVFNTNVPFGCCRGCL